MTVPREALKASLFALGAVLAVVGVVGRARHDSADPARCGSLAPVGTRCCAPGQREEAGRCVGRPSRCPVGMAATDEGCVAAARHVPVREGVLHAGAGDWEADGRVVPHDARVGAFEIDALEVTEDVYAACADVGACAKVPLSGEPGRPVTGITESEAGAVCRFRGGRLPTEDEWTWAAGGAGARRYPWGDTGAVCRRAAWGLQDGPCGSHATGPEIAGSHPDGASPEGVEDLAGNVAEWVVTAAADADANAKMSGTTTVASVRDGVVRGGSFRDALATDLRTWRRRVVPRDAHLPEIGARCAYDAPARP